MSGDEMTMTLLGGALGLFVLGCLAVIVGRLNDAGPVCECTGDCRQGRDCPARGKR